MAAPKVYTHKVGVGSIDEQIPCCYAQRTTNQSLTANQWNNISFESSKYCTGSMWSTGNADEIIIPRNGLYLVIFTTGISGTSGGSFDVKIASTGSVVDSRAYTTNVFRSSDSNTYGQTTNVGLYRKGDTVYGSVFPSATSATYNNTTYDGLSVTYLGGVAV